MGCAFSNAHQRFTKQKSIKRLRQSTLYADKLKANNVPKIIPLKCRMVVMKELGNELRKLSPEVEFKGKKKGDSRLDRDKAQMKMTTQTAEDLAVWIRR